MLVRLVACLIGLSSFWGAGPALQAAFGIVAAIYVVGRMLWRLAKRLRLFSLVGRVP